MVEVFKTNVTSPRDALNVLNKIHDTLHGYKANFDLQDCDRILRVESINGAIDIAAVLNGLAGFGVDASVLADQTPAASGKEIAADRSTA